MIAKLISLISLSTILYTSEYFFEKLFLLRPWKPLFVTTDDSIQEWWFRWKIDRYVSPPTFFIFLKHEILHERKIHNILMFDLQSVIFGMIFAFAYEMFKKFHLIYEHNSEYLFSFRATVCSFILSLIGFGVSFLLFDFLFCGILFCFLAFSPSFYLSQPVAILHQVSYHNFIPSLTPYIKHPVSLTFFFWRLFTFFKFYLVFNITCHKKQDCNVVHPFLVFIPVSISFLYFLSFSTFFYFFSFSFVSFSPVLCTEKFSLWLYVFVCLTSLTGKQFCLHCLHFICFFYNVLTYCHLFTDCIIYCSAKPLLPISISL